MNDDWSPEAPKRLFAVCLGGRAPRCNVELHDVAFAVGASLEEVHFDLLSSWFGEPDDLHVDAWAVLDRVPGFRIELRREPSDSDLNLYFVNIGGYEPNEFGERHAWAFYAGASRGDIKLRARRELLKGKQSVHRDDLHVIDDIIDVNPGPGWHLHITPDPDAESAAVTNGYFPIPKATIRAWKQRASE